MLAQMTVVLALLAAMFSLLAAVLTLKKMGRLIGRLEKLMAHGQESVAEPVMPDASSSDTSAQKTGALPTVRGQPVTPRIMLKKSGSGSAKKSTGPVVPPHPATMGPGTSSSLPMVKPIVKDPEPPPPAPKPPAPPPAPPKAKAEDADYLNFNCPECGQNIEAPLSMMGQKIPCPVCSHAINIPVREKEQGIIEAAPEIAAKEELGARKDTTIRMELGDLSNLPSPTPRSITIKRRDIKFRQM